jgi:feruloyl-CoA synthase
VSVGPLRLRFLDHFAPFARDVVFAGPDRDDIGALVFPDIEACRKHAGLAAEASAADVLAHASVRAAFKDRLVSLLATSLGSSTRVMRLLLTPEAASLDKGEITDKGSINQRAVLNNRAHLVEVLYDPVPSGDVITVET